MTNQVCVIKASSHIAWYRFIGKDTNKHEELLKDNRRWQSDLMKINNWKYNLRKMWSLKTTNLNSEFMIPVH